MRTVNKKLLSLLIVAAMVLSFVPAINVPVSAAETDAWAELDATLANATGDVPAYCPVCETEATWTDGHALGGDLGDFKLSEGAVNQHFYFSADTTYDGTGRFLLIQGISACIHLNGKTITSEGGINVQRGKAEGATDYTDGVLNVMGGGEFIYTNVNYPAEAALYGYRGQSTINLYGGTFSSVTEKTSAPAPVVAFGPNSLKASSILNVYEGATLLAPEGSNTVEYRSTSETTTDEETGEEVTTTTIGKYAFNVYGGTVEGTVTMNDGCSAILSGAAKVGKIVKPAKTVTDMMNIWGLTDGASIGISGKGSFSGMDSKADPVVNAGDYVRYFHTEDANCTIGVTRYGRVTVFDNSPLSVTITTDAETGDETHTAYCPYCDGDKTWTPLSGSTATAYRTSKGHFYFTGTYTNTNTTNFINANATEMCVHLNGQSVSAASRVFLTGASGGTTYGIVNFMGTGTYKTTGTAAPFAWFYGGTLNLFGGNVSTTGSANILATSAKSSGAAISAVTEVNMYGGTLGADLVVDGETTTNPNANTTVSWTGGTFNLYGGTIQNGVGTIGNISMTNGAFNMYGGTISGGKATGTGGGNISMTNGTFTMYGGTISGGTATASGGAGNILKSGGTFTMYGGSIEGGENTAGTGGNLKQTETGAFNMYGDAKISGGIAATNGGNIVSTSEFHMYDNAEIFGGKANGALGYGGNGNVSGTFTMEGNAKIYDGEATGKSGTADNLRMNGTLILSGNAKILGTKDEGGALVMAGGTVTLLNRASIIGDGTRAMRFPIQINSGILQINNDWTGRTAISATNPDTSSYYTCGDTINSTQAVCGIYDAETGGFTPQGAFNGTLRYWNKTDSLDILVRGVDGALKLSTSEIATEDDFTGYDSNEEALDAYKGKGFIRLYEGGDITLSQDTYVDVCGNEDVVIHNGEHKVGLMNTSNAFSHTAANRLVIEVDNDDKVHIAFDNPADYDDYYYFSYKDEDGWSAHRVQGEISSVTLRTQLTSDPDYGFGMYYKAVIECDAFLGSKIDTYGVVYNGNAMPFGNFMNTENTYYTENETFTVGQEHTVLSGLVRFTKNGKDAESTEDDLTAEWCDRPIYAAPYIVIGDEFLVMDGTDHSLNSLVKGLQDLLGENEKLDAFITRWKAYLNVR